MTHPHPAPPLAELVAQHRTEILAAVQRHHAYNPRLFGSTARGEDTAGSDVDILEVELTSILGVPVDVVPARTLKPHVAASALADSIPL